MRGSTKTSSTPAFSAGLLIAILLVAANLRATLTGVGTLLPAIQHDTGLNASWGGVLSTLPLLTFALTSPFVSRISHRCGSARVLVVAFAALAAGTIVRSLPSLACLFIGTVILSAAIAFGNVLLPSIIRSQVPPRHIPMVSSLYVTVMGLVAAVSSGISVPLSNVLPGSWRTSLAWALIFALIALAVWFPRARNDRPDASTASPRAGAPWRSALAWQVAIFMGLQSLGFYTVIAWLPSILEHEGMDLSGAGWMLFFYQVVALASSMALPLVTRGRTDQRFTAALASVFVASGFMLLLVAPSLALLACVLLGLGGGACLVLALSFQSQRAGGPSEAAALAGMAQSIGYLIAAAGPLLLGVLHDATNGWTMPLITLVALNLVMAFFGYGAGRDKLVAPATPTKNTPPKN